MGTFITAAIIMLCPGWLGTTFLNPLAVPDGRPAGNIDRQLNVATPLVVAGTFFLPLATLGWCGCLPRLGAALVLLAFFLPVSPVIVLISYEALTRVWRAWRGRLRVSVEPGGAVHPVRFWWV